MTPPTIAPSFGLSAQASILCSAACCSWFQQCTCTQFSPCYMSQVFWDAPTAGCSLIQTSTTCLHLMSLPPAGGCCSNEVSGFCCLVFPLLFPNKIHLFFAQSSSGIVWRRVKSCLTCWIRRRLRRQRRCRHSEPRGVQPYESSAFISLRKTVGDSTTAPLLVPKFTSGAPLWLDTDRACVYVSTCKG